MFEVQCERRHQVRLFYSEHTKGWPDNALSPPPPFFLLSKVLESVKEWVRVDQLVSF